MIAKQKIYFSILLLIGICVNTFSQGTTCSNAQPFCSSTGLEFQNTSGVTSSEPGPNYGCLGSQPNPAWYYIRIDQAGNLNLQIEQNTSSDFTGTGLDVDFICYGPFTESEINAGVCGNLTASNTVGCSYSGSAIENFSITNALSDQYYILLITNYSNQPGFIRMYETNPGGPNTGTTDCSIVAGELGVDQDICEGTIVTLDGTPTTGTAINYEWLVDTGSGFTTITGETNPTLNITNNLSGTYQVIITDSSNNTATDEVIINFYPVPVANTPTDQLFCDTDNDGFNAFDLEADVTPQVLAAQDPNQFEVLYFLNQSDADNNNTANALPNPYTNPTPFSSQT
ncbi:PKD domain-containing protein, partial [Tenacibaculum geojense]